MKFTQYPLILLFITICSCNYDSQKKDNDTVINTSSGWWIYGEGLHLYKDEVSLEENVIHFLNERHDMFSICTVTYPKAIGILQRKTIKVNNV